jgi:AcrR family transcriptional regulator
MQTPRTAKAAPANDSADTRSRILSAAQWLFRKRGYHATGVNDILAAANAPKGSLYHHFPGGKEEIGVAVIQAITEGLLGLFAASRARSTEALLLQAGERLVAIAEQTQFELCTVLSGFTAERRTSPLQARWFFSAPRERTRAGDRGIGGRRIASFAGASRCRAISTRDQASRDTLSPRLKRRSARNSRAKLKNLPLASQEVLVSPSPRWSAANHGDQ